MNKALWRLGNARNGYGLKSVVNAFIRDAESMPQHEREDALSSLNGQAFTKIQDEKCLTDKTLPQC